LDTERTAATDVGTCATLVGTVSPRPTSPVKETFSRGAPASRASMLHEGGLDLAFDSESEAAQIRGGESKAGSADIVDVGWEDEWVVADVPRSRRLPHTPQRAVAAAETHAKPVGLLKEFVSSTNDGFVHVAPTPSTVARSLQRHRPGTAGALLWAWLVLLALGELAVTIWWLASMGLLGLLLLGAPVGLAVSLALTILSPEQVLAVVISVVLAAAPALPAYSAVLLLLPPGSAPGRSNDSCWEMLHCPTLAVLGMMYLAMALLPVLRAEHPSPGCVVRGVMRALEASQRVARGACVLAAWLYLAVSLHVGAAYLCTLRSQGGTQETTVAGRSLPPVTLAGPLTDGRGRVLCLHALGLLCAEARQRTMTALGEQMLPCLLGAERARAFTLRSLAQHHGRRLLSRMPTLRRSAPPALVVALVIAVRRTAPVLFPSLALLSQLVGRQGWQMFALALCLALIALVIVVAERERHALPHSPLRRLPLLLPSGIAPCTRKVLGYSLTALEGMEQARGGIASLRRRLPRTWTASAYPASEGQWLQRQR